MAFLKGRDPGSCSLLDSSSACPHTQQKINKSVHNRGWGEKMADSVCLMNVCYVSYIYHIQRFAHFNDMSLKQMTAIFFKISSAQLWIFWNHQLSFFKYKNTDLIHPDYFSVCILMPWPECLRDGKAMGMRTWHRKHLRWLWSTGSLKMQLPYR